MLRKSRYDTKFGELASVMLVKSRMNQTTLSQRMGVSNSYISQVFTGRKPVPENWIELIASVLNLSTDQKTELVEAAKLDSKPNP